MSRFDAGTVVDPMEFDFTKFGGRVGEIPDPSTGQVNEYLGGMRRVIRESKGMVPDAPDGEDMSTEEMADALDNMDESLARIEEFQVTVVNLTAALCSDTPNAEELGRLPMRVMRQFSKWLMQEINPKEEGEGAEVRQLPAPRDRQKPRATKGSQKARR